MQHMHFRELMHVDDADDELKDKEKMEKIEAQQEALKKMHIRRILGEKKKINLEILLKKTSLFCRKRRINEQNA